MLYHSRLPRFKQASSLLLPSSHLDPLDSPPPASIPLLLHHPSLSCPLSSCDAHPRKRRSWIDYALILLLLIVLGTLTVLSTANAYFGIYPIDIILPSELATPSLPSRVPKIIHQTWKTSNILSRWVPVRQSCADLHEDWEYMLWTDETGRDLIANQYPWFLDIYDGYQYPIQRADAVRYFILHHYGGVYMDLDIGCLRPMDDLLRFDMVLPQTTPVGISNDLMFSAKGHPFMDFVIHRLAHFDHNYHFNYATVMFSTGPMALSALLSQFRSSLPLGSSSSLSFGPVRVLPPKMYGKNLASPQPHPGPFFTHYHGSSWHTGGAGFVLWLGNFGIFGLYGGMLVVAGWGARVLMKKMLSRHSTDDPRQPSRTWASGFGTKHRSSGGALWKRRIRRARQAEARIADAFLLPAHWLERAAALPSTHKHLRLPRIHSLKSHQHYKCCKLDKDAPSPNDAELPPYESGPSRQLLGPRTSHDTRTDDKFDLNPQARDYDDAGGAESSSDSSEYLLTTPTPILVPSTPTFYRTTSSNSSSTGSTPAGSTVPNDTNDLSSPLQKAMHRLAELAGIITEADAPENMPLVPTRDGISEDLVSSSPSRLSSNWSGALRKID